MKHEEIIKRENGTQYLICCLLYIDNIQSTFKYSTYVTTRQKGKRNWNALPDTLSQYEFRGLDMEQRNIHRDKNALRFVTEEEIMKVKKNLWNKLNPELNK